MRDLPWRHGEPRDPYSVVVSEVMLQQTQVTTVLRYYDKWMALFPTFEALAKAPIEKVLKAWEGMGYYTRARNLKKLAEAIVMTHKGQLPREVEALLQLPGIGPYSARSIASLAWGTPAACVDGNVVRVIARLRNIDRAYNSGSAAQKDFQPIANEMAQISSEGNFHNRFHPGEYNEAMMEFGATICTKANPLCQQCPLRSMCGAYAAGTQESLPRFASRQTESRLVKRVWLRHQGQLLLHQSHRTHSRAAHGHLDGLWELPTADSLGIKRLPQKEILRRVRNITKYKITEVIYKITKVDNLLPKIERLAHFRWVTPAQLAQLPLSGPHALWIQELLGRKAEL